MVAAQDTPRYKILVISDYRSITSSRAEAEIFVRLAEQGHIIHVLTFKEAPYSDRFRAAGIEVIEKHPNKKISFSFIRYLRNIVLENQYDFVHAYNSKGLTNAVWALIGLDPKLITYRGYAGQTHWYDPVMYLKYFHPRVDNIICVSEDIEDILAKNMMSGHRKLTYIPKGHDPVWYQNITAEKRSILGVPDDAILVCFLANNRPFKGLDYLIEATHLLPTTIPLHFLFVGLGYDDPDTQKAMQESPYKNRFHEAGFQQNPLPLLAACDCLISASTHGEGLSKVIVEAMYLGIAPIITAIGGNKGLVVDGESGWVIPIKDSKAIASALINMTSDQTERERRGHNAQVHIQKHFNIERSVELHKALYARLLGQTVNG